MLGLLRSWGHCGSSSELRSWLCLFVPAMALLRAALAMRTASTLPRSLTQATGWGRADRIVIAASLHFLPLFFCVCMCWHPVARVGMMRQRLVIAARPARTPSRLFRWTGSFASSHTSVAIRHGRESTSVLNRHCFVHHLLLKLASRFASCCGMSKSPSCPVSHLNLANCEFATRGSGSFAWDMTQLVNARC